MIMGKNSDCTIALTVYIIVRVKMRKPDPGIWNLAMGIAQVSPKQWFI